ncbi:MAG TPA: hypothetical protein VH063_18940 [Gaiellaceae bacterium]|nr:hypothetical protein [Gaiellaceae bacterium]
MTDGDTVEVVSGDDYLAADSRALDWAGTAWPDITAGAILLRLLNPTGTTFEKAGTVVSATEAQVELTADDTAALIEPNWLYALTATLADGHVVTLATGALTVLQEPPALGLDLIDYVTLDAVKKSRSLVSQSFADEDLVLSISAASRLVDDETHRYFGKDPDATSVRYYTASRHGVIEIDDLIELTEFATDPTGYGDYTNIWSYPTDILLDPPNAPLKAQPWERITVRQRVPSLGRFPGYGGYGGPYVIGKFWWPYRIPQAVRVTGRFGWPEVPAKVQEAVMILAPRLVLRKREAPWAIVGLGNESGGMRLSMTDPDVCKLLARYTRDVYFA